MSFSTQVKVMPPSLLLSLKRSRNVPGGLVLRMALSRSLLMKPMMYLERVAGGPRMAMCSSLHSSRAWPGCQFSFPGRFFALNTQQGLGSKSIPGPICPWTRHLLCQDRTQGIPPQAQPNQESLAKAHPSFHSARMYFFTRSMMLSSQTQKEKPFPAIFS